MSGDLPRQIKGILQRQSTFTRADLSRVERRNRLPSGSLGPNLPGIVRIGTDSQGQERFTGRAMLAIERSMADAATSLQGRKRHGICSGLRSSAAMREIEALSCSE